ncbi:acyl-CoA dehydrogenase family protein [Mitsuaria sp. BK037]|uniref:acyl-CoA dehydrogenase family protein n=1 Tax=Mitsuaria sp. BK037 TaxID=2587122 RepID=UPI0017F0D0B8|nr:acyl-CoA dehydrogenase family protein [Mitsuaria sp. BK037]MBB3280228.1 putative acyl-CoA dehydrogenase [Mitsuaria sp. BK037]
MSPMDTTPTAPGAPDVPTAAGPAAAAGATGWRTHEVTNQVDELAGHSPLAIDPALREALARAGADAFVPGLAEYASWLGRPETQAIAERINRVTPTLESFDKRGRRIDRVEFDPGWHALLAAYRRADLVAMPLRDERPGRWAAWAAGFYLHGQIEAGTLCPATMTQASIPVLRREPALWAALREQLLSTDYDGRDLPLADKRSIWLGMGMTEKQGGSDVRANTTRAEPVGAGGRGADYRLTGHKWFFSAPMCDAHLVVAKTPDGAPGCFFVPRWRPDGTKNAVHIQRLKDKVGNRSNSSSEVEFQDAHGVLMGEEGRGIPTIIEMATYTRLNCVVGSAAMLRQALVQALHYARHRSAFGRRLAAQPLMRAVLVDLALESEAAMQLSLRLAQAFERQDDPGERTWMRLVTPAAKFWVCKRAVELTGEAMEVLGGNGYIDDGVMGRLYREAPVNSIWEGSGNVMCLDVMRAVARDPQAFLALLDGLDEALRDDAPARAELDALRAMLATPPDQLEALGRRFASRLVLLAQAALLRAHAPAFVADAFIASRFDPHWGAVAGALDLGGLDADAVLHRAFPA